MQKTSGKKPREDQIFATTKPGINRIRIETNGEYVIFGDEMTGAYCEQSHDRDSGKKKIITQIYQNEFDGFTFSSDNALMRYSKGGLSLWFRGHDTR